MKIRVTTLLITLLSIGTVRAAETNIATTGVNAALAATNQAGKLKGILSETKVLHPDQATIEKTRAITPRMRVSSGPKPEKRGPQSLQAAADYLADNVSMACPPGACFEYDGWFYFSGGLSTALETDFLSGYAIKKGDTAIYDWEKDSPDKGKRSTPVPEQKKGK